MFFSHGTAHSKGVLILVKDQLDFKLQLVKVDSQGRYVLLEAIIQDSPFLLIYAPNKCSEQCDFFKTISEELKRSFTLSDFSVIIGGDFNVIFDQELDGSGGLKKTKDSVKVLEDICLEHDLLDIWRVRHPKEKRFTWRQKTPVIQRRLDFWLISDGLQDDVVSVDIKPSIKSDHSAITLLINGVDDSERGPSFWKFNSSLVNDSDYRFLLDENIKNWLEEFKEIVNSVLYSFIWKGKDKVKRHALISDVEMGGLKMLDIDSMISAKRIICLKKFLEDYQSTWKTILDKLLSPVGGRFVLHCNFHTSKLKISLPDYYKECFDAWSDLNGKTPTCYREIINELIWNNRFLCHDKKSMYRRDIVNLGFIKIGDLITEDNSFLYGINSLVNPEQRFFLMSIVNSIPAEWRSFVKVSTDVLVVDPLPNIPTIRMESDNLVPILDASSKQIYQLFLRKKQIPPTAKQKITNKYPNAVINWQKVYSLAFQTTLESKIREFQYKILNCIVFTNEKLSRIGLVESPSCTFCHEVAESVEHLFFSCKISSDFWKHVLSWLRVNNVLVGTIDESDLILGKFDIANDFILINHILLIGKYYIYSRRCLNSVPTLRGFIARARRVYNIELHIAREKNKLLAHFQKWEKLINVLTS